MADIIIKDAREMYECTISVVHGDVGTDFVVDLEGIDLPEDCGEGDKVLVVLLKK